MNFLVSFEHHTVQFGAGRFLFPKRHELRFEWFALLAYKRVALPADQAWVSLDEVALLPSWRGRKRHHIATNIGRYLRSLQDSPVVVSGNPWSGPYRLETNPLAITFDIPRFDVRHRLHLRPHSEGQDRQILWDFTGRYASPFQLDLILTSNKYGYTANAIDLDGEITVLAGSRASKNKELAQNVYASLREQLIRDRRLKPVDGTDLLEFVENVTFASPSAAATVINNSNTNGRTAWKLKSTGQTLKEWQDAQMQ